MGTSGPHPHRHQVMALNARLSVIGHDSVLIASLKNAEVAKAITDLHSSRKHRVLGSLSLKLIRLGTYFRPSPPDPLSHTLVCVESASAKRLFLRKRAMGEGEKTDLDARSGSCEKG